MTTGKTIALTIWTFVSKVMSVLFFFGINYTSEWAIATAFHSVVVSQGSLDLGAGGR